MEKQNYSDKTK